MRSLLVVALIVFIIVAIVFGPQVTIWALNTLFGLKIPITLETWFATLWLCSIVGASYKFKRD